MGNERFSIFALVLFATLAFSRGLDEEGNLNENSNENSNENVESGDDFVQITRQERKFRTYSTDPSGPQIISYFEDEKDYQDDNDLEDIAPIKTEFGHHRPKHHHQHQRHHPKVLNQRQEAPKRGLVPQLWANYTGPPETPAENVSCNVARLKCAYRAGCGLALQSYVLACQDLSKGKTDTCNTHCKHALIALMSTHEGKRLMQCDCGDDAFCHNSKKNIGACADSVARATRPSTVVSCTSAQWICAADAPCATALDYYNRFCGAMFRGRKCTERCKNSIAILRRQSAAKKLETCVCDGTEEYDCRAIKRNMDDLCFQEEEIDNTIEGASSAFIFRAKRWLLVLCVALSLLASLIFGSEENQS